MKIWLFFFFFPLTFYGSTYTFQEPKNWKLADPAKYKKSVQIAFVCPKKRFFSPSINLATEHVSTSLSTYLAAVQRLHKQEPDTKWTSLGTLDTEIGTAHLSLIECENEFGKIHIYQSILLHHQTAVILSGVCLKKEKAQFRPLFVQAMKSLQGWDTLLDCIPSAAMQQEFQDLIATSNWKNVEKWIQTHFKKRGLCLQLSLLQYAKEQKNTY